MKPFQASIREKDNYVIMFLSGSSTAVNKQAKEVLNLRNKFKELAKKYNRVIVDFKEVEYIASDTIGAILSGNAIMKKNDGKVVLSSASDYVKKIFDIVRLGDVLDICSELDEAEKVIFKD